MGHRDERGEEEESPSRPCEIPPGLLGGAYSRCHLPQGCYARSGTSRVRSWWCANTGFEASAGRVMAAASCTSMTSARCPCAISTPSSVTPLLVCGGDGGLWGGVEKESGSQVCPRSPALSEPKLSASLNPKERQPRLDMVGHLSNLSTGEVRQENQGFKASLSYRGVQG